MWFPALLVAHHRRADTIGGPGEFEFRWIDTIAGGTFKIHNEDVEISPSAAFFRSREEIFDAETTRIHPSKIGKIRRPAFLNRSTGQSIDSSVRSLFDAAVPTIAAVLKKMDSKLTIVKEYKKFVANQSGIRHRSIYDHASWLDSLRLHLPPEFDEAIVQPLAKLLAHKDLESVELRTRTDRVESIGQVLLALLYIQHNLGEAYDLSGHLLTDFKLNRVCVGRFSDESVLRAMFLQSEGDPVTIEEYQRLEAKFVMEHSIYDADFRPRIWERVGNAEKRPPSIFVILPAPKRSRSVPDNEDEDGTSIRKRLRPHPRPRKRYNH
ncbi:unnamed protein product [Mycena citricolor]|uniref:Uncharacterized protein n=1 Tax=Mycena citricolor TaxID=2018698 RepID=A0AAD2K5Y7_9AGAR|nr:unnamed protein product [Mycena citricolor]